MPTDCEHELKIATKGKGYVLGFERNIKLKIAIGDAPHTVDLKSGKIAIEGVDPEFVEVVPIIGAFRRMVRNLEFDVCEMAPVTYMLARAHGAPFIALPIFLHRLFHHNGLLCRQGSGIQSPKDLEGKRVGVRAYSVTTGVWKRGIMMQDFGLDVSKVTWVVDDEEAVPDLELPSNVVHAPEGKSLVALWAEGDLDAAFTGPAGLGRQGAPSADWNAQAQQAESVASYDLFQDGFAQAAEFYTRTNVYPHHGLLVVKQSVLEEHPWVARSLFDAASAAKKPLLEMLQSDKCGNAEVERYRQLSSVIGEDPLPYGVEANRASIDALMNYALDQKLLHAPIPSEDLFVEID